MVSKLLGSYVLYTSPTLQRRQAFCIARSFSLLVSKYSGLFNVPFILLSLILFRLKKQFLHNARPAAKNWQIRCLIIWQRDFMHLLRARNVLRGGIYHKKHLIALCCPGSDACSFQRNNISDTMSEIT